MKRLGTLILMVAFSIFAAVLTGCSNSESPTAPAGAQNIQPQNLQTQSSATGDIVDTAIGAGVFNTLVAAVQAAGLESALRGDGPFTVFAPTDDAFAKLPDGFVAKLLLPQNQDKLKELLLYHVVAGKVLSGDLKWSQFPMTLQGGYLWIRKLWGGTVMVNNARVISADVLATNGVIHVINAVLIPKGFELEPDPPTMDIVDTAIGAGVFNTLVAAVQAAELVDALRSEGPFTVFAPSDDAFAKLPSGLVAALLLPENKSKLQELLTYHVVAGKILSKDLKFYQHVTTLQGDQVVVIKWFGNVWVNFARVTTPDVLASNGVIHVINRVLIPRGFALSINGTQFDKAALDAVVEENDPQEAPPSKTDMEAMEVSN